MAWQLFIGFDDEEYVAINELYPSWGEACDAAVEYLSTRYLPSRCDICRLDAIEIISRMHLAEVNKRFEAEIDGDDLIVREVLIDVGTK